MIPYQNCIENVTNSIEGEKEKANNLTSTLPQIFTISIILPQCLHTTHPQKHNMYAITFD